MEHLQIMKTMHMLADVYGPRLTGSPNHKQAAEWAIKQMTEWGFENGHLEPWNFGHPGWLNERLTDKPTQDREKEGEELVRFQISDLRQNHRPPDHRSKIKDRRPKSQDPSPQTRSYPPIKLMVREGVTNCGSLM